MGVAVAGPPPRPPPLRGRGGVAASSVLNQMHRIALRDAVFLLSQLEYSASIATRFAARCVAAATLRRSRLVRYSLLVTQSRSDCKFR